MGRRRKKVHETTPADTAPDVVISNDVIKSTDTKVMKEIKKKHGHNPKGIGIKKNEPFNLVTKKTGTINRLEQKFINRLEDAINAQVD